MTAHLFWGDVAELKYGKALRGYRESNGLAQVFGTNGPVGWTDQWQSEGPGVIVGRKGAYRGVHFSPGPFWVIDTAYYLVPRREMDLKFAYYSLKNTDINGLGSGSAIPSTTREDFYALPVRLPCIAEQRAIAEVLGALDDKIAANRRLMETAEDLAISMLDKVPTSPLGDIVVHRRATQLPSASGARLVAHYSLPAFDATGSPELVDPIEIKSSKFRIEAPSVLISKLNPRFPRVWEVPEISDTPAVASTEFLVLEPKFGSTATLWAALRQVEVGRQLESMVAGTSGSHQRVKPAEVLAVQVADPRNLEAARVQRVESLTAVMHAARRESADLVAMRDTLLPRLMSGELRVRDAEGGVSQAV